MRLSIPVDVAYIVGVDPTEKNPEAVFKMVYEQKVFAHIQVRIKTHASAKEGKVILLITEVTYWNDKVIHFDAEINSERIAGSFNLATCKGKIQDRTTS